MNDPSTDPQFSDPGPGGEPGGAAEPPALERYRREGLLGLGGMGRVYAARDRVLHRQVALKVAATPALASRLEREARVTAQLEHPGIVAVYDAGVQDGQAWYAMRMIRGRTLRERIAACADLSARLALLPHLHAACQAVAYAHAMGIVHRDLKPSNLIVGEFGETQVADWGLACPTEAARADWERLAPGVSTTSGGTVGFMSPEQAEGLPAQPSGDVYALGAALCELLGGGAGGAASSPVDGASDRLLALPADAPPELVAIARRCLQTVAADRYPTAVELADDLGRWMSGQRVLAHEYRPREILGRLVRAWRAPLLVAAAALVLLGGVAAVGIERTLREQVRAEENLALALALQARQALSEYRNPEAVVLAAHSLRLAESPEARGVLAGAFHEQALLLDRQPLPAGCQYQGVLSRNGDRIACVVDGKVEVWRFGPLRRELAIEVQVDSAPVWVGDRLFLSRTQAAEWVDPDGTMRTVATGGLPLPSLDGVYLVSGPLVAHVDLDGSFRQFDTCPSTRASITVGDGQLMVGCADGLLRTYTRDGVMTRERLVSEGPPDWASVGHAGGKLLIGGFDGSVQTYDLETGAWSPPVPGGLGAVRAVIAVPGLEQLLVLAERGGPRVFSAAIGGWTGSLPRGVAMIRPGTQAGEVLTVGEFLDRWQLPPQPEPHILPFTAGVSHVAIAPAGDRVAVALGTGEIVERRMSDGGVSGTWSWSDEVAKCVVYLADDRLVAGAMGGGGRYLLRSGETVPLDKPAVLRRVGRFADGGFWALAYGESLQFDAKGVARPLGAGPDPIDGGSSPDGRLAVVVDGSGDIWQGDGTGWTTVARVAGAIAVDVGDGGSPLVAARRREVCVGTRCTAIEDDVVDVAVHGDLVAVGTLSGDVHVLSAATGASRALLRGHQSRIAAVEFAPGGHWLVSGSWDHTARVWDLRALDEAADSLAERGQSRWGLGLDAALRGG